MFGASSPCWRVEQGSSSNVVTTGNNFVLSGPLHYLFFLIQSVTNPFYHFFRISFNNVAIGESISLNFCTKSPDTGKLTEYDSQILCYGGDTSTGASTIGTNGKGIMVLNAKRVGINKLNPLEDLDVNGTINCTKLNVYDGFITSGSPINMEKIMSNSIESKTKFSMIDGSNNSVSYFKINNTSATFNNSITVQNAADQSDSTTISYHEISTTSLNTTHVNTASINATSTINTGNLYSFSLDAPSNLFLGCRRQMLFQTNYYGGSSYTWCQLKCGGLTCVNTGYGISNNGNFFAKSIYLCKGTLDANDSLLLDNDPTADNYNTRIGFSDVETLEVKVDKITFLNDTPGTSEQVIRGSQDHTYFKKWNGTAYDGLSHLHGKSLKLTGNYGFTTAGNVFANNIYPSTGDVHTDVLPALPTTTIPSSNQNYIINGNFSTPLFPIVGASLLVSDMTSSQLKSLYPWICYNGKSNVMIHNAETYSFPPFTGAIQGITQIMEIQNDASIYQIVNVPSDNTYRLQMYYAYSELGYDINNLSIYVDSIWRSNLMTVIPEVTPPNVWTLFSFDIMLTEGNHIITISGQSDYYTSEWLTIGTGITNVTLNQITSIGGTPVMTSSSTVSNPRNQWTSDGDIVVKSLAIQKSSYGISTKGELTVNTITISNSDSNKCDLNLGAGTLTCGTLKYTSISDGNMMITETTGSTASYSTGSLIIKHKNEGGSSSIVFPASKANSDYGYIQFNEGDGTGDLANPLERRASLIIGCENDVGNKGDCVIIRPNSNNTGNVGINTASAKVPTCALDINGECQATTLSTLNNDGVNQYFKAEHDGTVTCSSLKFFRQVTISSVRFQFGGAGAAATYVSCNAWDTSLMRVNGTVRFTGSVTGTNLIYDTNYYVKSIINKYQIQLAISTIASASAISFGTTAINIASTTVIVLYYGNNPSPMTVIEKFQIGNQNATQNTLNQLQINNKSGVSGDVISIDTHTDSTSGSTYGALTSTNVFKVNAAGEITCNQLKVGTQAAPNDYFFASDGYLKARQIMGNYLDIGSLESNPLYCGSIQVGSSYGMNNTGALKCSALQVGSTASTVNIGSNAFTTTGSVTANTFNVGYNTNTPSFSTTNIGYQTPAATGTTTTTTTTAVLLDGANRTPFLTASSAVGAGVWMIVANANYVTSNTASWNACLSINKGTTFFIERLSSQLHANNGGNTFKYHSTCTVLQVTGAVTTQINAQLYFDTAIALTLANTVTCTVRLVCTRIA